MQYLIFSLFFLYFLFSLGFKVNYTICFQVKKNQHGVFLQQVHCYTADPVVTHSIFSLKFLSDYKGFCSVFYYLCHNVKWFGSG